MISSRVTHPFDITDLSPGDVFLLPSEEGSLFAIKEFSPTGEVVSIETEEDEVLRWNVADVSTVIVTSRRRAREIRKEKAKR